jgi:hypothetical protein
MLSITGDNGYKFFPPKQALDLGPEYIKTGSKIQAPLFPF